MRRRGPEGNIGDDLRALERRVNSINREIGNLIESLSRVNELIERKKNEVRSKSEILVFRYLFDVLREVSSEITQKSLNPLDDQLITDLKNAQKNRKYKDEFSALTSSLISHLNDLIKILNNVVSNLESLKSSLNKSASYQSEIKTLESLINEIKGKINLLREKLDLLREKLENF